MPPDTDDRTGRRRIAEAVHGKVEATIRARSRHATPRWPRAQTTPHTEDTRPHAAEPTNAAKRRRPTRNEGGTPEIGAERDDATRESGGPRPARALPSPASYSSPNGPALRANPCPEVTDPICRLPLPTLLHRLEAVNLGDLLRIWVRPGTKITSLRRIFKGRRERTGHRKSRGALREPRFPISGQADSRDWVPYKEKRTLPGALADVSDFVCVAARDPCGPISVSRFGNIDPTPFRSDTGNFHVFSCSSEASPPFRNGALLSLRAD